MAENIYEGSVGSTNEASKKKKNIRRGRFPSNNNQLGNAFKDNVQPHSHEENRGENEYKRAFNKPYGDRCEYGIAQLSYTSTSDLPPADLSEKKFSGRNRIYIGNIGAEICVEDLEALFKPYGEVSEVFVNKEKSFGFIKLDYYANAVKARKELDGVQLKSKVLKLKLSPSSGLVRVRNLAPYVTSELLLYAFSPFGEVENATVSVDEKGKSTGEGIVDFARKNSAHHAIQKCRDKCYFLSYSLRPVVVEPYEAVDHTVGLLDKHFNKRNAEFYQEEKMRTQAQIRQSEEILQAKMLRQQDNVALREEEASLLMQAQNLSSILESQERLDYDAPTSSTREMTATGYDSFSKSSSVSHTGSDGFNQAWNRPVMEGRWIREDPGNNRGFHPKRRRF